MHACGPGPIPAISTTFTPRSGPVPCPSSYVMRVSLPLADRARMSAPARLARARILGRP